MDWDSLERIETLGLDEIALAPGHDSAVTVVSARQGDQLRVLAVLPDRRKATVKGFLASLPERLKTTIQRVCTDLYDGYIHAVYEALPGVQVVADRYVAKHDHETVDELRKQEMKRLREALPEADYEPLKGLMWVLRRDWEDLTTNQPYRDHGFEEITNYFPERHTSGFVEGLNHKVQNLKRGCYGLFDLNKLVRRLRLDVEGYQLFGLT